MVANQGKITNLAGTPSTGLVDGTDKLHSGILKTLESFSQGDMCISHAGFTITDAGTYTQYNLAQPIKFTSKGQYVSYTSGNLTVAYSSTVADASNDRYDWVLLNPNIGGTPAIVIVQGTAASAPLVADITAGYIPIALVKIDAGSANDATSRNFQLYTMSKVSNSLSIGHNDSGYTESGNITGDANSIDIVSTPSNADINLVPNGTGKVGVGTASPATKLHVVGGTTPIVRVDGDTNNATTTVDNNIQGVEISKHGMNTTNKYNGGYKFTSTDTSFTTHSPKMLAAMVHRALQTYDADNKGNSAIDFFIHDGTTTDGTGPASVKHTLTSSALGIGTDDPAAEVHITGASAPELRLQEDGNDGYTSVVAYSDSYGGLAVRDNAGSDSTILDIDVESAGTGAQTLRLFRTSNASATSTKFQILSAGTTTEVFRVAADDGDTTIAQSLKLSVASQDGYIDNIIDDKDIIFRASTSSATNEIMRVDSTQQAVSIGTVTSNAKLTVDGDISRKGLIRNVTTVIGASGAPSPLPVYSVLDTDDLIIASAPSGGVPPNSLDVQLPDAAAEDIGRTYRIVAIDVAAGLTLNRTGSDDVFVDESFAGISLPLSLSVGKVYDITCIDANKWMVMTLN